MSALFPHLFSPLRVGQLTLRNRIVSTPHATGYVTGSLPDEREVYYQAEKAKGGVGLQFMGATNVMRAQRYLGIPANVDDAIVPIYRRIAAAVHAHGGLIGAQLTHVGAMGDASLQEAAVIDQAVKRLTQGGQKKIDFPHRIYRIYGRQLSVARPDSLTTAAVFFANDRLYQIESTKFAGGSDTDAIRFQQSLTFDRNVANRTRQQMEAFRVACQGRNGNPAGLDDPRCVRQ